MKVCLFAGDMNINRKPEKKVCKKVQNFVLLGNKMVKTFFSSPYNSMGYIACIMF